MANGNFAGTMAAVQGSSSGARAIAAGMQQMSQSTHDMAQAKTMEAADKDADQKKGANSRVDGAVEQNSTTPTSVGHLGDASPSQSGTSGSGINQGVTAPQGHLGQGGSQPQSTGGIPIMADSGKPSTASGTSVSGSSQNASAATGSAAQATNASIVPAFGKQNDLDSPHLKSFEQHLEQRYGAGSDKLAKAQTDELDNLLKQDEKAMQQNFAGDFNRVRDGMMGMIGKGQDQSVGAVQIRSSV